MQNESLFRLSLKCLIKNDQGEVLVVKERGRTTWDLPGGGMDYGEDFKKAIARELSEEVNFQGGFTYRIVAVEDPGKLLTREVWQVRLIFLIESSYVSFSVGKEADSIMFVPPKALERSNSEVERLVYKYARLA